MKLHPLAFFLAVFVMLNVSFAPPKKYTCRAGHIHVESYSRFLDVIADNYQVYSELDPSTGNVSFAGLLKAFTFEMGALDRAFNSGKVDVSAYNKFTFEGLVVNVGKINFDRPGTYPAQVKGTLFMGGQKRITTANGEVRVFVDGKIEATANFVLTIEEKSMQTINKLMREKLPSVLSIDANKLGISRDIKLKLKANYRPKN
jgi:hypothetical protein